MRLLKKIPNYATIDYSTFNSGDEIGPRVHLRGGLSQGMGGYITANFTNQSAISGGTTSEVRCFNSNSSVVSTGNRSSLINGTPTTATSTPTQSIASGFPTFTPVLSWSLRNNGANPIWNDYWTCTLTHDRTGGVTNVDLLIFEA